MQHRAFAFDWTAFEGDLLPLLERALETEDAEPLGAFIDAHRCELRDPYEGELLPEDWRSRLEAGDVQELADFALTRYYRPGDDQGLGPAWAAIDDAADSGVRAALLGRPIGPETHPFDPGRMGSFFQRPSDVERSAMALAEARSFGLSDYQRLLGRCIGEGLGLYVTF
jgi:hypothetical protein